MANIDDAIENLKIGLNRDTSDKFYTKISVARQCIEDVKQHLDYDNKKDMFIEPSAGSGSFSNIMFREFDNVLAYDLYPDTTAQNNTIQTKDHLTFIPNNNNDSRYIHYIGNPPFGRQSSTAKKFIKQCNSASNKTRSISFILPKSFKKESMQKAFALEYHKIFERDLEENAFMIGNKSHDVPCVFQIWSKKDNNEKRQLEIKEDPFHFKFVKKNANPDFSLRRVGVYAGTIYSEIENKSEQSHYFIQLLDPLNTDQYKNIFIDKYNEHITFNHNNTVGPKSVGKHEFTKKLNVLINKLLE